MRNELLVTNNSEVFIKPNTFNIDNDIILY